MKLNKSTVTEALIVVVLLSLLALSFTDFAKQMVVINWKDYIYLNLDNAIMVAIGIFTVYDLVKNHRIRISFSFNKPLIHT